MERNRVSLPAANQPSDNPIGVADEFWRDDAVAMQQAEAIRQEEMRTGIRMPPPSASRASARSNGHSFDIESSRSKQRSALWWVVVITSGIIVGSVACGVIGFAAGWFVLTRQDVITLEEFERLQNGMTLEQCNQIVGKPATESFSTETFGQSDRVFTWQNSGGTVVSASFVNGKLQSKIQLGLN